MKMGESDIKKLEEVVKKTRDPNLIRLFNRDRDAKDMHPDLKKIINSGAEENPAEQKKSCI